MTDPSVEQVRWLTSAAGHDAVSLATRVWRETRDPLRASARLRRDGLEPDQAARALSQVVLRERAAPRFGGMADRLWLTDDGLAQASRPAISRRRADRLRRHGCRHVADLGCGLGLDALFMAAAGMRVTAVERDPAVAAMARANLALGAAPGSAGPADPCQAPAADATSAADLTTVLTADVTTPATVDALVEAGVDAAFVDPARRDPAAPRHADGRAHRILDPSLWSPPWPWVSALPERIPAVVAKLAPGIPRDLAPGWETEWTSVDGDLLEATAWSPALARAGTTRTATLLRTATGDPTVVASVGELTDADDPFGEGGDAPVAGVGQYLLEPDDAVIRAGLVGAVVAACDGWLLDRRIAYVSCDRAPDGVWAARTYRVLAVGPFDTRWLRRSVKEMRAGDVVVKKRGIHADPAAVRRAVRPRGDGPAVTVVLTRTARGSAALVVEPLPR